MEDDYRDSDYPRQCQCCGVSIKAVSRTLCHECELGATSPSRWCKAHDWEPVAVVFPARYVKRPQVVWYDAATYGHRQQQIHLACRIASLTDGEVRLLSEDVLQVVSREDADEARRIDGGRRFQSVAAVPTLAASSLPTAPTARQAGLSRRTPTPAVEVSAAGAEVPRG